MCLPDLLSKPEVRATRAGKGWLQRLTARHGAWISHYLFLLKDLLTRDEMMGCRGIDKKKAKPTLEKQIPLLA